MGRVAAVLLASIVCASCVSSTSNVCSDGSICPGGFVCDVDNQRCLLPGQLAACGDAPEGADCMFEGAPGACRSGACELYFCGDGYITVGEDCDGDVLPADTDCRDFGYYGVEGLACSSGCRFDDAVCRATHDYCGDGEVNGAELCDGPQTRTCVSIGFDAGTTTCNLQCGFTIGDCSRFGWNPESLSDVVALAVAGSARDDQWAFGMNGRAMRFEGVYWNSVPTGVQNDLIAGWSNSATDTWAVGSSSSQPVRPSVVLRWDGAVWSPVTGIPAGEYTAVWGTGPDDVYVATAAGAVHRYNGTGWSTLPALTGAPRAMHGTSGTDLYVATQLGPLWHFDGTSWTDRSPAGVFIEMLDVNASDDVWAVGLLASNLGTGVIAHWNGSSWTTWVTPQESYNGVASSAPNDTWVAGADGIMRHWDGTAWARSTNIGASPSGLVALSGLISLGAGEVVGVSTLNLAYRYRGQAFGVFRPLGPNPFDAVNAEAFWSFAANNVYVALETGEIWRFDGTSWSLVHTLPVTTPHLVSMWASAPDDLWVVDDDEVVYHFDGETWSSEVAAAGRKLRRVWGDGAGDLWLFGDAATAFRREAGVWVSRPIATGLVEVESVSGTGPNDVWVVVRPAAGPTQLWRWDGGAWSQVNPGASTPVRAVIALAPDDVHVAAAQGRMLRFNGTAWTESVIPVLEDLRFFAATATDDVIAASARDLAHFDGRAWSTMRPPVDFTPNTADYLPIVGLHASPGRIDMLLERYRIRTLIRTRPLVCRQDETCGDAVDNDCDNLVDTADAQECP